MPCEYIYISMTLESVVLSCQKPWHMSPAFPREKKKIESSWWRWACVYMFVCSTMVCSTYQLVLSYQLSSSGTGGSERYMCIYTPKPFSSYPREFSCARRAILQIDMLNRLWNLRFSTSQKTLPSQQDEETSKKFLKRLNRWLNGLWRSRICSKTLWLLY